METRQLDLVHLNGPEFSDATKFLRWSIEEFHPRIGLSSSFGLEDVVLIDMVSKISPQIKIFTLDTGRLHQETYDLMDTIRSKYNVQIQVYFPNHVEVEKMVKEKGLNLFYDSVENRKLCCGVRKVEPLNRALADLDAWITGIRRDQTANRGDAKRVEIDHAHNDMLKLNPLIDWTFEEVQEYVKRNEIPYNVLHDRGFPSIGCEPCTRAVAPGEDPRAGRWWWELGNKECGLHVHDTNKPVHLK